MEYFKFIDKVKYEGKDSKNPMSLLPESNKGMGF